MDVLIPGEVPQLLELWPELVGGDDSYCSQVGLGDPGASLCRGRHGEVRGEAKARCGVVC